MKEGTTIAVDAAKSVFEIAVSMRAGRVADRYGLSRGESLPNDRSVWRGTRRT